MPISTNGHGPIRYVEKYKKQEALKLDNRR